MITQPTEKNPFKDNLTPVITILVPTFNGEKTLRRALGSIISEIEIHQLVDFVRVVISDNCSTDQTGKIVEELSKGRSWIKSFQPSSHQSLEGNLRFAMKLVETPYVKILSDDDVLLDGFLVNLFQILETNWGVDLIVSSLLALGEGIKRPPNSRMPFVQKSDGSPAFIAVTGGAFGQLSTLCFKTSSWFDSDNSPIFFNHKYYGLEFAGRVYHLIVFGNCIFDDSELIEYDNGPKRWNNSHLDVFQVNCFHAAFIFQMAELDQNNFPNSTNWNDWLIRTKKGWTRQLIFDLVSLRREGLNVADDLVSRYIPNGAKKSPFLLFILTYMDFVPPLLCSFAIKISILLNKIRSRISR
jgi:glycosyltransferase involved in cell wall biosynthesis